MKAFLHSHSYTGNPLACRVALEVLQIFEEEHYIEQIAEKSAYMKELASNVFHHQPDAPDPLPSLCQRNPATTQSAVRSCLTLSITLLSCRYGRSAGLTITPSNPAPSKRVNQSSATSGWSVIGVRCTRASRSSRMGAGRGGGRTVRR